MSITRKELSRVIGMVDGYSRGHLVGTMCGKGKHRGKRRKERMLGKTSSRYKKGDGLVADAGGRGKGLGRTMSLYSGISL